MKTAPVIALLLVLDRLAGLARQQLESAVREALARNRADGITFEIEGSTVRLAGRAHAARAAAVERAVRALAGVDEVDNRIEPIP